MVLRAADTDTPSHVHVSHDPGCSHRTGGTWRQRYHHLGFWGLQDAPRSGRPRTIVASTRVRVISVASALPHGDHGTLDDFVFQRRNAERPLAAIRLRDILSADRLSMIRLAVDPVMEVVETTLQVLPIFLLGLPIDPWAASRL